MFSLLKKKHQGGMLGLEVRPDGLAIAMAESRGDAASPVLTSNSFIPCKAAERQDCLNEYVQQHNLKGQLCNLVLGNDQYQIFQLEKPAVPDEELADAARWKLKDLLDYPLEDAVVDVFDFPEGVQTAAGTMLNVVACRRIMVQQAVDLVNASGLEMGSIDIAELALGNITQHCAEYDDQPLGLLYIRHGMGMMVLVKSRQLYISRHFNFSLDALREPSQQETVIQQLGLEVQRSLDYFESQMRQVPPQKIFLIGPDPNVPLANMLGGSLAANVAPLDVRPFVEENFNFSDQVIDCFISSGAAFREAVV